MDELCSRWLFGLGLATAAGRGGLWWWLCWSLVAGRVVVAPGCLLFRAPPHHTSPGMGASMGKRSVLSALASGVLAAGCWCWLRGSAKMALSSGVLYTFGV